MAGDHLPKDVGKMLFRFLQELANGHSGNRTPVPDLQGKARFSLDDINIASSTTDDIPLSETDSVITYNPSFASSETTIDSYKSEKTINSRKSRYNTLPRRKYADIALTHGIVSSDADVSD
ncbi:hypothetical protein EI94DRAFT_1787324, partial [Lactarius quietus]